jgi:hypothetical protein
MLDICKFQIPKDVGIKFDFEVGLKNLTTHISTLRDFAVTGHLSESSLYTR